MRSSRVLPILVVVLSAISPKADAAPLLTVLGSPNRHVDMSDPASGMVQVRFPLAVDPVEDDAEVMMRLATFARGDRALDFDPGWLLPYRPAEHRTDRAELELTLPADAIEEAGTYTFTLEYWKRASGSAADVSHEGSLVVSVVRPAAELSLQVPLKIERVVGYPLRGVVLTPSSLLLSETTGRNFVELTSPAADGAAVVPLRSGANSETVAHLQVQLPGSIPAGQHADVPLTLEGSPPLGSVTGTLRLVSTQLDPRAVSASIEVVTRVHRIWLLVAIVVGIGLGTLVRGIWERGKTRKRAHAAALRASAEIKDAIARVADDASRRELNDVLAALHAVREAKRSTAKQLTEASNEALVKLQRLLGRLETDRATLDAEIAEKIAAFGDPNALQVLELSALEHVADALEQAAGAVKTGDLTCARENDEKADKALPALQDGLTLELDKLVGALESAASWPEAEGQDVPAAFRAEAAELAEGLSSSDPSYAVLGQTARKLDFLLRRRAPAVGRRSAAIRSLVDDVAGSLGSVPSWASLERLEELKRSLDAFRAESESANGKDLFIALFTTEKHLHHATSAALAAVSKAIDPTVPPPETVGSGRFREALTELFQRAGLGSLGAPRQAAFPPAGPTTGGEAVLPVPAAWTLRIVAPGTVRVGTTLIMTAELVAAPGTSPPVPASVTWKINGNAQAASGANGLTCVYAPTREEPELDVRLELTAETAGYRRTVNASATVHVRPREELERAAALDRKAGAIDVYQSVIVGALIAVAGYTIFEGTYVGSLSDWVSALFWGFGIELTVAKALEYSAPLTAKALPS